MLRPSAQICHPRRRGTIHRAPGKSASPAVGPACLELRRASSPALSSLVAPASLPASSLICSGGPLGPCCCLHTADITRLPSPTKLHDPEPVAQAFRPEAPAFSSLPSKRACPPEERVFCATKDLNPPAHLNRSAFSRPPISSRTFAFISCSSPLQYISCHDISPGPGPLVVPSFCPADPTRDFSVS